MILGAAGAVMVALAWIAVGIFALTRDRFLGSWLLLAGGLLDLGNYLINWLYGQFFSLRFWENFYLISMAVNLASGACLVAGALLWILRAGSLKKRLGEVQGVADRLKQES